MTQVRAPETNEVEYPCSNCGKMTERSLLMVKKVLFVTMGDAPRSIKNRRIGWLCPACVSKDEHWNIPNARGARKGKVNG